MTKCKINNKFCSTLSALLIFLLSACGEETFEEKADVFSAQQYYKVLPGTQAWEEFTTHQQMVEASQLPAELVEQMTTEELLLVVANYPLLGDIGLFNNRANGFSKVAERFNGLKNLAERPDAGEKILDELRKLPSSKNIQHEIPLSLLASQRVFFSQLTMQQLNDLRQILRAPYVRALPSLEIREDGISKATQQLDAKQVTIKTPRGTDVPAYKVLEDMTVEDIDYYDSYIAQTYPRATKYRSSSEMYNCHSFAWVSQGTKNDIWLETPGDDTFWRDGSYYGVKAANLAVKDRVSYSKDDHSAVNMGNKTFLSKWGSGPLMKHAPTYCPYDSSSLRYFRRAK